MKGASQLSQDQQLLELVEQVTDLLQAGRPDEVDALLRAHPERGEHLRSLLPALSMLADLRDAPEVGADVTSASVAAPDGGVQGVLGDFRILREIGRGGMGVVYEAEQISLGRRVALKVLPFAAVMDPRHLQRFKNEAQAAAALHHTNIVPVFAVGNERGVHFYAMQYIDGRTLAEVVAELRGEPGAGVGSLLTLAPGTSTDESGSSSGASTVAEAHGETQSGAGLTGGKSSESAEYFRAVARVGIQVAEALDHAHQQGVVHRDVKPSNLMLDGQGKTWITDFGLARFDTNPGLTMTGDILGTLRYMSPEQAQAQRTVIDHRTDIYSLGVSLYELLALRPAFPGEDRGALLRAVAYDEPRSPRRFNRAVPGELETIVMKAMAKSPEDRYETAQQLADDLRRYLEDQPILARRPGWVIRARKWARRHRQLVWSAGVSAALLLLTAVVVLSFANRAIRTERDQKTRALTDKENALRLQAEALGEKQEALTTAQASDARSRRQLARMNVAYGARLREEGKLFDALPWFAQALEADQDDPARSAGHRLRLGGILAECPRLVHVWFHDAAVDDALFSPDGSAVATVSGNEVKVWDTLSGQRLAVDKRAGKVIHAEFSADGLLGLTVTGRSVMVHDLQSGEPACPELSHRPTGPIKYASFNPDGDRVVTAGKGGRAIVWDLATGKQLFTIRHEGSVTFAGFSPDGQQILTTTDHDEGVGRISDAATGALLGEYKSAAPVIGGAFSPDGKYVAVFNEWETIYVIATDDVRLATTIRRPSYIRTVEFSPDGRHLIVANSNRENYVRRVATGEIVGDPMVHDGPFMYAAYSHDGRLLASASGDSTARVWDARSGSPVTPPLRHGGKVRRARFSPGGRWLVTASWDGTARLWELDPNEPIRLQHQRDVVAVAFSPVGRHVLTASLDGTARVWDAATGAPVTPSLKHGDAVRHAAFSPDGTRVATASRDGTACVWDVDSGRRLMTVSHADSATFAAFSPGGKRLVTASDDTTARVWEVASGRPLTPPLPHDGKVVHARFSPDGKLVVTGCHSALGGARVWDSATGEPLSPPLNYGDKVVSVEFSSDGSRCAYATMGHEAVVWDPARGGARLTSFGHGSAVHGFRFSSDGRRALTASWDGKAQVWDVATGKPLAPPLLHDHRVHHALFSPNQRWVLTITDVGTPQFWNAETSEAMTPPLKQWGEVLAATFSPDGRRVVAAYRDGAARIWDVPFETRPVEDVLRIAQVLAGQRIDETSHAVGFVPLGVEQLRSDWEHLDEKYPQVGSLETEQYDWQLWQSQSLIERADALAVEGQYRRAAALYSRAWDQLEPYVEAHLEDAALRDRLHNAAIRGWKMLAMDGRPGEAAEARLRMCEIWTQCRDRLPDDLSFVKFEAVWRRHAADMLSIAGRTAEAIAEYRFAALQFDQLRALPEYSGLFHREAYFVQRSLGWLLLGEGEFEAAEAAFAAAVPICQRMADEEDDPWPTEQRELMRASVEVARWAARGTDDLYELPGWLLQDHTNLNHMAWYMVRHPGPSQPAVDLAVRLAERAVALKPSWGGWWNTLAVAYYRAGRWQDAAVTLGVSHDLYQDVNYHNALLSALVRAQLGEDEAARNWLQVCLPRVRRGNLTDEHRNTWCEAVMVFRAAGIGLPAPPPEDNRTMAMRVVQFDPDAAYAHAKLAKHLAETRPEQAQKHREQADAIYAQLNEQAVDDWRVWYGRGVRAHDQRKFAEAVELYDKALALDRGQWQVWYERSHCSRDIAARLADVDKSLELAPRESMVWHRRGHLLERMGADRRAEAEAAFAKSVELHPDYAPYWRCHGDVLNELGRWDEAIEKYSRSVELNPINADTYRHRFNALVIAERRDEAQADLLRLLELSAANSATVARLAARHGFWNVAIAANAARLEADPDDAVARRDRATAYYRAGQREAALADVRVAEGKADWSTLKGSVVADQYLELGDWESAVRCYSRLIELSELDGVPLYFADGFESGATYWEPTDPAAWRIEEEVDGQNVYNLFRRQSDYKPPRLSPIHISLCRMAAVGDFILTARVKSTVADYEYRDVCVFFGYQDPAHYYYAQLSKQADDRANQVFIVDGAPRKKISTTTTSGTPWDDAWHDVKVVRRVASGEIKVYFDDMDTPAMTASDRTFGAGRVGIGSFDDPCQWDDVRLYTKGRNNERSILTLLAKRCYAYQQLGDASAAREDWQELAERACDQSSSWNAVVAQCGQIGYRQGATSAYEQFVQFAGEGTYKGDAFANLGRWQEADAELARVASSNASFAAWQPFVKLAQGDVEGYRQACAKAVAETELIPHPLTWTVAVSPHSGVSSELLLRSAQGNASPRTDYQRARALAAALIRAGEYQQAATQLMLTRNLNTNDSVSCWLLAALAHHHLGNEADARRWLAKAADWIDGAKAGRDEHLCSIRWTAIHWTERVALETLRREAEELIGPASVP